MLRPFWNYFGGKWRAALSYPAPVHATIVEPFAGAAGYSLRHHERAIVLVEKYAVIAEIWRWLIGASVADVGRVPLVECIEDLPSHVPDGARHLVGFCLNSGATAPRRSLSNGLRKLRARGHQMVGWSEARRARVQQQVGAIKHWKIIEGDYSSAPDVEATYFVDPPYQGVGDEYIHGTHDINFSELATWCRSRRGQVMACEQSGASWLNFRDVKSAKSLRGFSREAMWTNTEAA